LVWPDSVGLKEDPKAFYPNRMRRERKREKRGRKKKRILMQKNLQELRTKS